MSTIAPGASLPDIALTRPDGSAVRPSVASTAATR